MVNCHITEDAQSITFDGTLIELMAQVDYINYKLVKSYSNDPLIYKLLIERFKHFDEIYKTFDQNE